jgi:coenzyme F420-reducing hydrogenase gamma subunit
MKYLGIQPRKPGIAVFDLTSCEGCELQLLNREETLADFLAAVDIVNFRLASSAASEDYEIALVEGAVSRYDEVKRLKKIREKAETLVALGSCACFGGVNRLKNRTDLKAANREVYGADPKETLWVKSVKEIVKVDMEIPGCPVSKSEVESVVQHLIWGAPHAFPVYPVCVDCKQRFASCLMDMGRLCLGPVTRGGCGAPCPAGGLGCMGCRGPATDPNYASFFAIALEKGFTMEQLDDHFDFFGGFPEVKVK